MIAIFDGKDYTLMLERKTQELTKLRREKLEAQLKQAWEPDKDLGKVVSLELADNNGSDGIKLAYLPENSEIWEAIKIIQVKINERAYNNIRVIGQFGTRYNGSDKIEIINGLPNEL